MASGTGFLQRRVGPCRTLDVVMVIVLGIVVVLTAVFILTLNPGTDADMNESDTIHDESCLDVAVIGAGIGGSYTAWGLRDKNLSISVFEYSDRVGGRLFSPHLPNSPGMYLELGGQRYLPGSHDILNRTVSDLGLDAVDYPQSSGDPGESIVYTRGRHLSYADLISDQLPYELDSNEKNKTPGELLWEVFNKYVNLSSNKFPSVMKCTP